MENSNYFAQSQIGQVLAITLINNTSLDSKTLRKCKLSLLEMAKNRQNNTLRTSNTVEINGNLAQEIKDIIFKKPVFT